MNDFTPKRSGLISNGTGTIYLISQSIFPHKTFCMEFIKTKPFITLVKLLKNYFCGTAGRSQTLPKIQGLQLKLKIKYETEKRINKNNFFEKKGVLIPS